MTSGELGGFEIGFELCNAITILITDGSGAIQILDRGGQAAVEALLTRQLRFRKRQRCSSLFNLRFDRFDLRWSLPFLGIFEICTRLSNSSRRFVAGSALGIGVK